MKAIRSAFAGLLLLGLVATDSHAQVGFRRKVFATGQRPEAVVVADFNGDGVLDLATANSVDNSVSIGLGNGDGTFGGKTDFATGLAPHGVAAADFNGDAKLDLATANDTDNSLSVLLGNGDGAFQSKVDFASGTGPVAVVAADFNADGHADLAAANRVANTVSVLLGNGDGTFQDKKDFPTNTEPLGIVARDFNGDGKLDIAASNGMANVTSVLLGNGDGTFGEKKDFATGSLPRSLTAADFNLDGKPDLATANESSDTASVLPGNGDGTFNLGTDQAMDSEPIAVAAPDFNNDGKPDLATANSGRFCTGFRSVAGHLVCIGWLFRPSLSVRLGSGDGMFGERRDIRLAPTSHPDLGPRVAGAATGDFNADESADVAVADPTLNQVNVYLQAPTLSLDPTALSFSNFQVVGVASAPMDVTVSSTGSFPAILDAAIVSGADAGDFSITADTCSGATLPVDATCLISVTFTPSSVGAKSAWLATPSNAVYNLVSLSGSGVSNEPVLQLPYENGFFGDVLVGDALLSLVATVQNNGGAVLTVSSLTIDGANAGDFRLSADDSSCSTPAIFTLEPGAACEIRVSFTPAAEGLRTANLVIASDSAGSPRAVALSGNGRNISIAPEPGAPSSITVQAGQSANFMLHFQAGSASRVVTVTCSHIIPFGSCSVPAEVVLNGAGPVSATVTVTTRARTSQSAMSSPRHRLPGGQPDPYAWMLAWPTLAMAGFLVGGRRAVHRQLRAAAMVIVVLSMLLWSGCGKGSSSEQHTTLLGTPPGTYSITVQASSGAGATGSITLNLTVQ